jgi:hypothetical protein
MSAAMPMPLSAPGHRRPTRLGDSVVAGDADDDRRRRLRELARTPFERAHKGWPDAAAASGVRAV